MNDNFTKEFFQTAWGKAGYQEDIKYGVGMDKICQVCLTPFFNSTKTALEIGCGGGSFTKRIVGNFKHLTAIDVIAPPPQFASFKNFSFYELPNQNTTCSGVPDSSIDFVWCYNVFCHLSDDMIASYLKGAHRVLKPGGDFVFMLSNFEKVRSYNPDPSKVYQRGEKMPLGHYMQDETTLGTVSRWYDWDVINPNMLPDHRDIVIHLRKK